jgi:hypothetical protein
MKSSLRRVMASRVSALERGRPPLPTGATVFHQIYIPCNDA